MKKNNCAFCDKKLSITVLDLKKQPIANSLQKNIRKKATKYDLHIMFCISCKLVQSIKYLPNKILFDDYAYFSSYSKYLLTHTKKYVDEIIKEIKINKQDTVIEIASNDGYLLKNFVNKKIKCIGIEPAKNVSLIAKNKGIPIINDYFNFSLSQKLKHIKPKLIIANNVLAHNMNIKDFIKSIANLSDLKTTITIEFPTIKNLLLKNQFDTIYHEHFFYFSATFLNHAFLKNGLKIYKAKKIELHGGSIRIYIRKINDKTKIQKSIINILEEEKNIGLDKPYIYKNYYKNIDILKTKVDNFFTKNQNKLVYGFGAAAKGNTFLNYFKIDSKKVKYIIDETPYKIGKYSPGNMIKIRDIDIIKKDKPDFIIILAWNHKGVIMAKLKYIRQWNGKFVIFIPNLRVI